MNISWGRVGIGTGRAAVPNGKGVLAAGAFVMLMLAACAPAPPIVPATRAAPATERPTALGEFTGMRATDLLALLGQPNLRRSDPPAELWQYRGTGCVLELYLYREGDALRVVHAETRGRSLTSGEGCPSMGNLSPIGPASTGLQQSRL